MLHDEELSNCCHSKHWLDLYILILVEPFRYQIINQLIWNSCKIQLQTVGWCCWNKLITFSCLPQSKITIAIKYSFIVTIYQILIDSLLQEQLDNLRWVVFYSILLYVITSMLCFPWHEKVYLCGALWWCFCSRVFIFPWFH